MPAETPYLSYSRYLRERHGAAVYRVAVDAGFTCPNRAGGRVQAGCSYCAPHGSRAPYVGEDQDLQCQVRNGLAFLQHRYGATEFILFFQAYSNTFAPVERLRRTYDAGLALAPFKGMNVATRPDCVDAERADLLASYRERNLEVWCELGLQSAHDETLRRIRRGHTWDHFRRAQELLKKRGVLVAAHLIFGLPGEGLEEILGTIDALAAVGIDGVKIHNLHVPTETALAGELLRGEITVCGPQRHLEYVVSALERLPPRTVIMRLLCDTPAEQLAAPRGFWEKSRFTREVASSMNARGTWQGRLSSASA